MGVTGVMLCDTRMRARFRRWQSALIAQRHPLSRCLTFTLMVVAVAYPNCAVRAADEAADLARLSLEVQRAEDIRAVKRLQITYAHYVQFGLWSQAASLFAGNAEAIFGADRLNGRAAIGKFLLHDMGQRPRGPASRRPAHAARGHAGPESLGGRSDRQGPLARILG